MLDATTSIDSIAGATKIDVKFPDTSVADFAPSDIFTVFSARIAAGFHTVTSPADVVYAVFVYGAAQSTAPDNTGYGYLAGYRYDKVYDEPYLLRTVFRLF